jgi:hypothetical protein
MRGLGVGPGSESSLAPANALQPTTEKVSNTDPLRHGEGAYSLELLSRGEWGVDDAQMLAAFRSIARQIGQHLRDSSPIGLIEIERWEGDYPWITWSSLEPTVHRVRLTSLGADWGRHAYQFAHEFGHAVTNSLWTFRGRHSWFYEAISDAASFYALNGLEREWAAVPEYEDWRHFPVRAYIESVRVWSPNGYALPPEVRSAADVPAWYAVNADPLAQEQDLSPRSKLAATFLLPRLTAEPGGWEALRWANLIPAVDSAGSFAQHLALWQSRVPDRHKPFVGRVASLFGI